MQPRARPSHTQRWIIFVAGLLACSAGLRAAFLPATPTTRLAERRHVDPTVVVSSDAPPPAGLALWYRRPAETWNDALPIGNGRLGAMVYGAVGEEKVALNEESLWLGYKRASVVNPKARSGLEKLKPLLFQHRASEAVAVIAEEIMAVPPRILPYQPLADLVIRSAGISEVSGYRRTLDLAQGIASVVFKSGDTTHTRQYFASAGSNVIVIHFSADRPAKISFEAELVRDRDAKSSAEPAATGVMLTGQLLSSYAGDPEPVPSIRFAGAMSAVLEGGRQHTSGNRLVVENATSAVLIITAATDYRKGDCVQISRKTRDAAAERSFASLLSDHIRTHSEAFGRVKLNLGASAATTRELPSNERVTRKDSSVPDPELAALTFQYGRYLLIQSSAPGSLPANLQGKWNIEMQPPWNCDYHTNINLQMNYWPAEVGNLSEYHTPLFHLIRLLSETGSETARKMYNTSGWVVHHLTDPFGFSAPADGPQGVWPMGGAWLALHLWEHYLFTRDEKFLKEQALPLMKGAADFILDFLVVAPADSLAPGKLVTVPSHSPENRFRLPGGGSSSLTYGATMDLQIIHELLTACIAASERVYTDDVFRNRCLASLRQLAPLQISKRDGRLQEWIGDFGEADRFHRHTSHLFGVYPGTQISPLRTPELALAARKSLEARTDRGAASWSLAWRMAIWARLFDGNRALGQLKQLLHSHMHPNLFAAYKLTNVVGYEPFQIDANLGATAAIAEMLLQSQNGELHFLPALPDEWRNGAVQGLCARGAFQVDLEWENSELRQARLVSKAGVLARVRSTRPLRVFNLGHEVVTKHVDNSTVEFETTPGTTYVLR